MAEGQKGLKAVRVAVAVAVAAAVAAMWTGYGGALYAALGWVGRTQIVLTALAASAGTVAVWLTVTLLFGRVYCSMFCPLGAVQDAAARLARLPGNRLARRMGVRRDYHYSPGRTRLRLGALAVVAVCLLAGLMAVPALVDPYGIYTGFIANVAKPLWGWAVNGVAALGEATGWWEAQRAPAAVASAFGAALSAATMGAVAVAAWLSGRLFCNTLCPVGTVLGIASARSLWHIDIDTDLCTQCRRCEWACKAQCIDLNDHVVDGSRCVMCFNCLAACPDGAITYRPDRKQLSLPMMQSVGKQAAPALDCQSTAQPTSNETIP